MVIQKLFSQHSFPARQESNYWDQGWSVKKDRNHTFAFIWKLYVHLFAFLQGGKYLKIHLEEPASSAVATLKCEFCTDRSVCAHCFKAEPSQAAAAGVRAASVSSRGCFPIAFPLLLNTENPTLQLPRPRNWFCLWKSPCPKSH